MPNYAGFGDWVCSCLAVLFGKRFDNHGPLENGGHYSMPDLRVYGQPKARFLPQNTTSPRTDYSVPLTLGEVSRILPLILTEENVSVNEKAMGTFGGAAKFYLQALQSIEHDPEVAFLHLITAGEILSNFHDYPQADLLDDDARKMLDGIRSASGDGPGLADQVAARLMMIKKRFVKTIVDLVDPTFFDRTESSEQYGALKQDTFEQKIKAAYDLRSRYVHTGVPFGSWIISLGDMKAEVQVGKPVSRIWSSRRLCIARRLTSVWSV